MQDSNLHAKVLDYLDAFDQRDLERCMRFFADDCLIDFASGKYKGQEAIKGWHNDRFKADMRVTRVEEIKVNGQTVVADVVATSQVARRWRVPSLAGRVTLVFDDDALIQSASFGLRMALPIEGW